MLSAVTHLPKHMAHSDQHHLQAINQIAEVLSTSECKSLVYLCERLDMDDDVNCVKEVLKRKVMYDENGHLFLAQLMLHLGRFDILRKVLKTSREQVERDLQNRHLLSEFRVLMVNISEDMSKEDVSSLKFLFATALPRDRMEKAKNFLDVTIELEKQDLVSAESVDLVEQCLRNINRVDLAKKVANYKTTVATSEQHSLASCLSSTLNLCQPVQQSRHTQFPHVENRAAPVYMQQNCRIPLDGYTFNTNARGVCVIIDCVGNDGAMLEQTFLGLHFHVMLHRWLSVNDTLSVLRALSRQRRNADGLVCCIISRGTKDRLLCTDPRGPGLDLDAVRRTFTADVCPMLAGKPKLFFIQRYSVAERQYHGRMQHRDEDLETDGCDGVHEYNIPRDADVFWSHCWTDEHQLKQTHHSSVYLKALSDALHKGQQRKTKLVDIHTEVNGVLFEHNSRNPGRNYHIDLRHTLRKDLYFS